MHSSRSFTASVFLLCLITGALLPPLHALRLTADQLAERRARRPAGKLPARLASDAPFVQRQAAQARWQTRWGRHGVARRLYLPAAQTLVGTWEERARQVLLQNDVDRLAGASELRLAGVRRSPGGVSVRLQQEVEGVPVWGGEVVVAFGNDQRPLIVANDLCASPATLPPSKPSRNADRVVETALLHIAVQGEPLAPATAELFWRTSESGWRLAWRVRFVSAQPVGDWQVWLDASTGTVLDSSDRTVYAHPQATRRMPAVGATSATASARVFLPDPVIATGNTALRDEDDAAQAVPQSAYTTVTLRGLDPAKGGFLSLSGEFVRLVDWETPEVAPVTSAGTTFLYDRSHSGFEDVMVYYHIDAMQRWFQSLGFADANNRVQPADSHGFWGEDNSRYIPTLGWLSFGEGGVDDAEDAAVIVHEYGHATQYDIVPTWGIGGHTSAMGEGFGDYLANSYAYGVDASRVMQWNGVFQWDGHNEFWPGRIVIDPTLHYPEDVGASAHDSGTLWCSALTDALYLLGDRAVMDQLVLAHHYLLTGSATMEDAANAILLSDLSINDGAHLAALTEVFARWGMLDRAEDAPALFVHEPPGPADAMQDMPTLQLRVVALDPARAPRRVMLHTRDEASNLFTWPMQSTGDDTWSAPLPGAGGSDVLWRYWFECFDDQENSVLFPATGASSAFEFVMGQVATDFESESGWSLAQSTTPATSGDWVRVVPTGTAWQPMRDHTPDGSVCWVTGNAAAGAPASDADVDDGATRLLSPRWDVSGSSMLQVHYWRWFATNATPGEDRWRVRASGDGGATWVVVEELTTGDPGWQRCQLDLTSQLPGATLLQLEFLVEDAGAGSLVEAALDDFVLRTRRSTSLSDPVPSASSLRAHPNPFNPRTTVSFTVAAAGAARVDVYDLRGRRIRRLFEGSVDVGPRQVVWNGRDDAGRSLASGLYLVRLRSGTDVLTRKVTLLR